MIMIISIKNVMKDVNNAAKKEMKLIMNVMNAILALNLL